MHRGTVLIIPKVPLVNHWFLCEEMLPAKFLYKAPVRGNGTPTEKQQHWQPKENYGKS